MCEHVSVWVDGWAGGWVGVCVCEWCGCLLMYWCCSVLESA